MAVAFNRYGSSTLMRLKRSSISGKISKSAFTEVSNSSDAPAIRVDTESDWRSASNLSRVTRMLCPTWVEIAFLVTSAVTCGFPSLSPPIQLPNESGRAVESRVIPNLFNSNAKSSRTCETVDLLKSSK